MDNGKNIEYLLDLMNERDRRYDERFKAQEKALKVATDALERQHNWAVGIITIATLILTLLVLSSGHWK